MAGQRAGSRRTSSASSMEFSSNTGMFSRTRLPKRNPRVVYRCLEAVSPSEEEHHEVARSTRRRRRRADHSPGRLGPESDRRSEEHMSELQSPCNLVCRLLLEKKKKK